MMTQETKQPEPDRSGSHLGSRDLALPDGWRWTSLGELKKSSLYGPRFSSDDYGDDGVFVLRTTDISESGKVDTSKAPRLRLSADELQRYRLVRGDLVITRTGSLGTLAVFNDELDAIAGAYLIQYRLAAPLITSWYVFYALKSPAGQNHLVGKGAGVGRPNLNAPTIDSFPFPLPPLPDQRRIVAEIEKQFTRLDAGIAALRRTQANLKRYRAAVLKAACEGRLVPTEAELHRESKSKKAKLETGAELLARVLTERRVNAKEGLKYKEPVSPNTAELPELPEGWTYASVEQLGFVQLGRQRAPQHHTGEFMRPYLRVANVFEDRIDLSDIKEMNFTPKEFEVFQLKPNDILLNEGQSLELIGRPAIYRGELPGVCFTNTLIRFRPCASLNVKFALSVFRAFMHSGRFQKIAKWTTNIAHLGADRFAKLAIPLPPLVEQTRIVAEVERRLSVVEELETVVTANLQRATRLRQSILQKAFAGHANSEGIT